MAFRVKFFATIVDGWESLSVDSKISILVALVVLDSLLEFTRPSPNSNFDIYNPCGIKLLTRLLLSLNHLNEHKFKHGFNDTINHSCICRGDIESINDFLLHCPEYCEVMQTLFDKMLLNQTESSLTHLLLSVALNANPMLIHLSSTRQLNSYYVNVSYILLNFIWRWHSGKWFSRLSR